MKCFCKFTDNPFLTQLLQIPRFLTRFMEIHKAINIIQNHVGPLDVAKNKYWIFHVHYPLDCPTTLANFMPGLGQ